jgi:very-short-patch-repair endonuclease
VPPASGLEARVIEILARAGLPPMRRQVDTGDEVRWIGRVDLRDEHLPLVLEIQSERFHTSLLDRQLDRERIGRLRHGGLTVVEILDDEVWHNPDRVVAKVRAGRADALESLARRSA